MVWLKKKFFFKGWLPDSQQEIACSQGYRKPCRFKSPCYVPSSLLLFWGCRGNRRKTRITRWSEWHISRLSKGENEERERVVHGTGGVRNQLF